VAWFSFIKQITATAYLMKLSKQISDKASNLNLEYGTISSLGRSQVRFWLAVLLLLLYLGLPLFFAHVTVMDGSFFEEMIRHGLISDYVRYTLVYGIFWWPLILWGWFKIRTRSSELAKRNLQSVLYEHNLLTQGQNGLYTPLLVRLVFGLGVLKPEIEIKWIHCPEPGQADAHNPAVIAIQKSPKIRRSIFEEPEFWGSIQGVRSHLITLDGADLEGKGADDFFFMLLSDRISDLPEQVQPGELPDPAELSAGKFPVGVNAFGETHYVDFTRFPNLLICGGTGSGKTMLTNWVIHCMAQQGIQLSVIDPDMQFDHIGEMEHIVFVQRATTIEEFSKVLKAEQEEMEARNRGERKRNPRVLIIDELPRVLEDEENIGILRNLAQRMRKQRMALVVVMQNPGAELLPPSIRDNFLWKLCGKLDNPEQVSNLFPGVQDAPSSVAQIQSPGVFLKADKTNLELIKTPYDVRFDHEEEGW
tara:strand:+ start:15863 stop:17290 length:1428 start_codon:yes stop_codon:yes gene_type:complete